MRVFLLAVALGMMACVTNGDDDGDGGGTSGTSGSGTGTSGGGTGTSGSGSGTSGSGSGTSGSGSGTSGASGSGNAACVGLGGIWVISGDCGPDVCDIDQTECATSVLCGGGAVLYAGSVANNQFTYTGETGSGLDSTCQGSVTGDTIAGTCTTALGTCSFTGQRQ